MRLLPPDACNVRRSGRDHKGHSALPRLPPKAEGGYHRRVTRRPVAAVLTLGCKLNLADSEEIVRGLQGAGYEVVDRLCEADAYVVNTCSVTHVADQKSRRLVRSARRLSPGAAVTVTGCFPQSAGFGAALDLGADLVVGTRDADKVQLVEFLAARLPAAREKVVGARRTGHTRTFVKAQEGCNDVCAFCIVPRTRGREVSRPVTAVIAEVNRALESGAKEVVITGTQLGAWGRDLDPPLLPHHLIAGILESTDVARVRFSSLQPQDITPELLGLWCDPRLMPHFHLALQSGSDAILQAMRRRYGASDFRLAAERIRAAVPGVAITTDVIAGFPGERPEDFEETFSLCREVGFSRLHCFPYSPRAGTSAARMPGQFPASVRKERMHSLLALGAELAEAFHVRNLGTVRPVLWESPAVLPEGPGFRGYTDNYVPVVARGADLRNRITPTRLDALYDDGVRGSLPGGDV